MPVSLTWNIEGAKEISMGLSKLAMEIKDFREPLNESANELLKSFETNFAAQGSLFGGWNQLKSSTISQKIRLSYPLNILERTGLLKGSFQKEVDSEKATLFNPVEYFKYHQSRGSRKKLPRRVMMKIDETRRGAIVQYFRNYIHKVTGRWTS